MASRRTRIKGIANIPQRRKTVTNSEEQPKAVSDSEKTGDGEPNLTLQRGDRSEEGSEEGAPEIAPPNCVAETPPKAIRENGVRSPLLGGVPEVEQGAEVGDKTKLAEVSNVDVKPVVSARRKFIKPAVSLNAISRKAKDTDNCQKPEKNKIVILNEVITHPDQEQPVVVGSFNKEETTLIVKEDSLSLKSPENESVTLINNFVEKDAPRPPPSNVPAVNHDAEYPIPPPSPSKVNRTRIKAVPRLSQRNTSFSASESEDESRRNHRHRNDSVCSTASCCPQDSIPECPSPQKPKQEFNSVIQRKCRRTEQSRKLAEARRDFYIRFGNKKPDRQKLTMIDLIFYNPTTNPMSHESKKKEEGVGMEAREEEEESVDDPTTGKSGGSDEENELPAPQIKIGPQGEIVVDERSLVIESRAVKRGREEMERSRLVDGDSDAGYGVYKRAKRSKDWNKQETLKFYKALNTIGTDFTLMCELFPRRSRRELKMKFKKEERINKALIDRAIMQPCGFDFNDFKHEVDMEEKELAEMEKQKERELRLKKEEKRRRADLTSKQPAKVAKIEEKPKKKQQKKKKQLDIMNVLDDTSDAEESESSVFDEEEVDEEEERQKTLLRTIQRPTRSGRVPKLSERYKAPECSKQAEPGSLIVVAGTGSNGEPVYRVCMVTAEHDRQQIGEDMDSLSKALECKQNGYIQSLFTLSSTTLPTSDDNVVEENNVTIDEEDNLIIEEDNDVPVVENNVTIPAEEEDIAPVVEEETRLSSADDTKG